MECRGDSVRAFLSNLRKARLPLGFLLFVLVGLVTGCAPSLDKYTPDSSLTPTNSASLSGTGPASFKLFGRPDVAINPTMVDGKAITTAWQTESGPVLVTPGPHSIGIGVRFDKSGGGIVTQETFEAGKSYHLVGQRQGRSLITVWFEDEASQQMVGEKAVICLSPDAPILQLFKRC